MVSNNSNKKEILLKAINVFIVKVGGYGSGVIFFWMIANKYGAKIQGIFSIAFMFLSVGAMISKLGIGTALVKWIASSTSVDSEKYVLTKAIKIVFFSSLLVGIVIYALSGVISQMYQKPDIELSIKYAAIAIPFLAILDISSNYFRGKKQTTTFGIYFHFIKFLFPLLVIICFYFLNIKTFEAPILSYLIGLMVIILIIYIHLNMVFKNHNIQVQPEYTSRFIISESYPMLVSSSIVLIMGWSDTFILGFFVSEEKIGIYGTAIKLATIVSFIYNAIATIAGPKIATYYSEKNSLALKETITFSSNIMMLSGLPIFLVLFIFPEFFLGIFGEEYIIGKTVLRLLLLAQFINVLTGQVGAIFNMTGNQKTLQKFILISLAINVVLSLLLVNKYDLEGVAVASALGMVVWNVLGSLYIYKKMNIKTWCSLKFKRRG